MHLRTPILEPPSSQLQLSLSVWCYHLFALDHVKSGFQMLSNGEIDFFLSLCEGLICGIVISESEINMAASNSATPRSNTKPKPLSPFKSKSVIFLHEWWLVKQCKGLTIGGVASMEKDRERVFLSTVIAKRHEANVLETEDGITVIFCGFINASRSCQNGFPSEVCRHFLVGFPHNWKKYSDHSFGVESINQVPEFGDSSACSEKRADVTPKKIFNGLGTSFRNVCQHSKSIASMDCSIVMKTMEYERKDDTDSLESPQLQVGMIYQGENATDVPVRSQDGNPEIGQSLTGIYDLNPCTRVSEKRRVKSPTSINKMKDRLSSDCKKQCIRQKEVEDTSNFCRRVTRSISKKNHKNDGKAGVTSASTPVRRSPRLYSCR
ncbi:hypothetical protein VNO77_04306 [Canavalia gladiata]|uniref:SANTA domain-containing protein n=1 Tax=Canavalia gladiata TaxID=3824 RepID=A0AAN9MWA4_CANGL